MGRTAAQRERQRNEHRESGRYAKVNPCQRCGKSAGVNYFSYRDSEVDSQGNEWGDSALVLCGPCCDHLYALTEAEAWAERASADWGGLKAAPKVKQ